MESPSFLWASTSTVPCSRSSATLVGGAGVEACGWTAGGRRGRCQRASGVAAGEGEGVDSGGQTRPGGGLSLFSSRWISQGSFSSSKRSCRKKASRASLLCRASAVCFSKAARRASAPCHSFRSSQAASNRRHRKSSRPQNQGRRYQGIATGGVRGARFSIGRGVVPAVEPEALFSPSVMRKLHFHKLPGRAKRVPPATEVRSGTARVRSRDCPLSADRRSGASPHPVACFPVPRGRSSTVRPGP